MSVIIKVHIEPFHMVVDDTLWPLISNLRLVEVSTPSYINRKIKQQYWPEASTSLHLDHINRNPFDYRVENLRLTDHHVNMQNRKYGDPNGPKIDYRIIGETEVWKELFCQRDSGVPEDIL